MGRYVHTSEMLCMGSLTACVLKDRLHLVFPGNLRLFQLNSGAHRTENVYIEMINEYFLADHACLIT